MKFTVEDVQYIHKVVGQLRLQNPVVYASEVARELYAKVSHYSHVSQAVLMDF